MTYFQTNPLSLDYISIMRLYISSFLLASDIMTSLVSDVLEASICNLDTSIDVRTGMPSFGKTNSEPRFQGTVKRVHNRVLRYCFPAEFLMIILPSRPFLLEIPIPPTNEFRGNWISRSISVRPFTLAGKPGSALQYFITQEKVYNMKALLLSQQRLICWSFLYKYITK